MIDTQHPTMEFSAWDRCDGCGAQAYMQATKDGQELLFCRHHIKKNHLLLQMSGWELAYDYDGLEALERPAEVVVNDV